MMTLMQNPSHPGKVLVVLCLEALGMCAIELARRVHCRARASSDW